MLFTIEKVFQFCIEVNSPTSCYMMAFVSVHRYIKGLLVNDNKKSLDTFHEAKENCV